VADAESSVESKWLHNQLIMANMPEEQMRKLRANQSNSQQKKKVVKIQKKGTKPSSKAMKRPGT